jgi:hypothetical protein
VGDDAPQAWAWRWSSRGRPRRTSG